MTQGAGMIDPKTAASIERAFEFSREGQTSAAIEVMKALAAEVPAEWPVQFCLALFLLRDGRFSEAVEPARLAVEQKPRSAKVSMVLYRALGGTRQYVELLDEMKRYLSLGQSGEYTDILMELKREMEAELEREEPCES
jgi:predicted Zn-dependent protease